MASSGTKLSFIWRLHNMTCLAWVLNIGPLKKLEPGCRTVTKLIEEGRD